MWHLSVVIRAPGAALHDQIDKKPKSDHSDGANGRPDIHHASPSSCVHSRSAEDVRNSAVSETSVSAAL